MAYFPRTDPGQFVINLKAPTGTNIDVTEELIARVEKIVREEVLPDDLDLIVSNIGSTPGFSSMYTPNSASHTAFVQASLHEDHRVGSYEYMDRVRRRIREELPQLTTYFQSGGLVDAVLNLGLPDADRRAGQRIESRGGLCDRFQDRHRDQAACPASTTC